MGDSGVLRLSASQDHGPNKVAPFDPRTNSILRDSNSSARPTTSQSSSLGYSDSTASFAGHVARLESAHSSPAAPGSSPQSDEPATMLNTADFFEYDHSRPKKGANGSSSGSLFEAARASREKEQRSSLYDSIDSTSSFPGGDHSDDDDATDLRPFLRRKG